MVEVEPPRRAPPKGITLREEWIPWDAIEAAILSLPNKQKRAVKMLLAEGLTHEEIGARMGVRRAAVTRLIGRAKRNAKGFLWAILDLPDEERKKFLRNP